MKTVCVLVLCGLAATAVALPQQQEAMVEQPGSKGIHESVVNVLNQRAPGSRIIGGTLAPKNSIPFQVAIQLDGSYFCGGSVLSGEWILTAAHCVKGFSSYQVVAGSTTWRYGNDRVIRTSRNGLYHAQYNSVIDPDIGVIRLNQQLQYSASIKPTILPKRSQAGLNLVGNRGFVSGWGITADSGEGHAVQNDLRFAPQIIISNAECAKLLESPEIANRNFIVCGSKQGGQGQCGGDSGGPLFLEGSGIQVGIVSFSWKDCEARRAGGFARVDQFLDWIQSNTGIHVQ